MTIAPKNSNSGVNNKQVTNGPGTNKQRFPLMEALMIFIFISASLWGCLGYVLSSFRSWQLNYMSITTLVREAA